MAFTIFSSFTACIDTTVWLTSVKISTILSKLYKANANENINNIIVVKKNRK